MKLISVLALTSLFLMIFQTPSYAAKRNWLKYCQSGKVAKVDRTKCKNLLKQYKEGMDTYDRTIGDMGSPYLPTTCRDRSETNCVRRY
jgi:hypothetical protein